MKFLYTALFLLTLSHSFAQKQNVYYFKGNGNYVDNPDSCDYYRIVKFPDSASFLYDVAEFYKHGEKKLTGKSTTLNPTYLDGQCIEFYKNGAQYATIHYKNGVLLGLAQYFYPNGKLSEVRMYPDTGDRYNLLNENYLIKENYDAGGNPLVIDGNGYYKGCDSVFNDIVEEGAVKGGKKDGEWKGVYLKTQIAFIEKYNDGKFASGTATYGDGTSSNYTGSRSTVPQFEGGINALSAFLGKNIRYPREEQKKGIHGIVVLSFWLEKDGTVNDVLVVKSVSPALDSEASRVLSKSPLWTPGIMFGRPVRVAYSIPITFALN